MKKIYFLSISVFFLSVGLFAQDYKWSVEANYPIPSGEVYGNDPSGIIDFGVKYRFLDFIFSPRFYKAILLNSTQSKNHLTKELKYPNTPK